MDGSFSVFFDLEYVTGGYKMALIEVSSFPGLNTAINQPSYATWLTLGQYAHRSVNSKPERALRRMEKASRQRNAIASVAGSVRAWVHEVVALATEVLVLNMQFAGTSPMK